MEQILNAIINYITITGYWGIIVGMALESACVPIPSELILGFAGYLVYLGKLNFSLAVIAGVAGGLFGSIAAYLIGFYGGKPFVAQYGKYILLPKRNVDVAQKWFNLYGLKATFFSRLLPVVRTFISLPAGFAKVNFIKFCIYTMLGSIPWTIALIYAGKSLGANWQILNAVGHKASLIVAGGLIIIAICYLLKRRTQASS